MPGDDPYATLKITGKWNSKTTEDYLAMCKEAIVGNKDMQRDLAVMAEEWRKAVVTVGRVQTPTLKMLVDRDAKILRFQKEKYYTVGIHSGSLKADSGRIADAETANSLKEKCTARNQFCYINFFIMISTPLYITSIGNHLQ